MQQDTGKWVYSNIVKDHFVNPKNFVKGGINPDDYDGVGYVGSPACGDMMKIAITVDKKEDKIIKCEWQTFGCASAIASTSVMSVMISDNGGMKIDEAMKITPKDIMEALHGLPMHKVHCSVLGDKALRAAINDYFKKSGQEDRIVREKSQVVCGCMDVTSHDIEDAVLHEKNTFKEVQQETGCGTACGSCMQRINNLIKSYNLQFFGDEDPENFKK